MKAIDDGQRFRYWIEKASSEPSRVAKAIQSCTYPEEYRRAIDDMIRADEPQTEEVEETWWRNKNGYTMLNVAPTKNLENWTISKVTYTRPKPRKVVREWVVEGGFDSTKLIQLSSNVSGRPDWIANTSGTFTYRAEVEE